MATREQQKSKYWPTEKAIALLDGTQPPPPVWQRGDVIAIGDHTLLRSYVIWKCTCGDPHDDRDVNVDWANGDVTHLIRDRKPVQP